MRPAGREAEYRALTLLKRFHWVHPLIRSLSQSISGYNIYCK